MRIFVCGLLISLSTLSQAFAADPRLMSDTAYKTFLNESDAKPTWEAALKRLDPAKTNISFAAGQSIVHSRDIGLQQIVYVRATVAKLRTKRMLSDELAIEGFLRGVSDAMTSILEMEVAAGVTLSNVEGFIGQVNPLMAQVRNDLYARVELLERGSCPQMSFEAPALAMWYRGPSTLR